MVLISNTDVERLRPRTKLFLRSSEVTSWVGITRNQRIGVSPVGTKFSHKEDFLLIKKSMLV